MFFTKDNERNLCQDLLTIENTNSDLKVHALHYANELLVRVRLSLQNFCKLAHHGETIRKKCLRVQTTINHISILTFLCFLYYNMNVKENVSFFRARAEKGIARHIDASSVVWTLAIFDWFVLSMRTQVFLDSLFARPGSAPMGVGGGGRKESSET